MDNLLRKLTLIALTLLCSLGALPSSAAAEETCRARLVPIVVLVSDPGSTGYIQPNCSMCRKLKVKTQATASGGTQGVLTLVYRDELQQGFVGSIELTLVLVDGTKNVVLIEDVVLAEGGEAEWVIDEVIGEWSWDQVGMVHMEMLAD